MRSFDLLISCNANRIISNVVESKIIKKSGNCGKQSKQKGTVNAVC